MTANKVVMSHRLYREFKNDQSKLRALEIAGVDKWKGWKEAMDIYEQMKKGERDGTFGKT